MRGKESISFTFPDIQEFWGRLVRRNVLSSALSLMICLATIATRFGLEDGPYLAIFLAYCGIQLALSLAYWTRQNKLIPRIVQRFAVEFMLRTGIPTLPGDVDVLRTKQTVFARDEDGEPHLWTVRRRRDVFTIAPA
ncbi:hypothetical protein [Arthrobacter sp. AZCC_0090]|uniref:hypothetical protein n=1 Tax=Arthrobacter sp. AZCC_0090 TaxID=2735881 RepID=UPI00160CE062|nr:hypothetical protein [Arthrobacter sp. AZCC_0090]MBB6406165.1 hypothetical protein [Arthrobacter sp. AZCC_0090]